MQIAVATSDKINADHFGRAQGFAIYRWEEGEPEYVEYRETNVTPGEKHQWNKGLSILEDCEVIIVAQAGMNAKYGIKQAGLKLVEEEGTVEEVVKSYIKHMEFMKKL
ncbi:MAG TPA: NifB/NifX family molybdenum-iron cluster-binding protein [Methanobacteriaceae archaeon]|nr:NifB/NifX family molybdenum-iron cluster-binding protein [Methanobacteriaceae archaeon]